MNKALHYPLEQLMTIKKNRFDQAVKRLEEKKKILEAAYEKLYDITQERDQVAQHKAAKLTQLREGLDTGLSSDKILQMKTYLKVVEENLQTKEKKVVAQQKEVDAAQKQVDLATEELFECKKDLEKLELHKAEWAKEARALEMQIEAGEHDEQSAATHALRKKEAERRRKEDLGH